MKRDFKTIVNGMIGTLMIFTINVAAEILIDSGAVSYSNTKTAETTVSGALDELFSAIEISQQIGDMTKISAIGDGTITGAINTLNNNLDIIENSVSELNSDKQDKIINLSYATYTETDTYGMGVLTIDISKYGFSKAPTTAFLQAQFRPFEKYQYNMEDSTSTELQFWIWYDSSLASQSVLNRYGIMIVT